MLAEFIFDIKAPAFIVGNTDVLKSGEPIILTDGRIGFGDGVTQIKDLVFNVSGNTIRNGAGAPSNSLGNNGDYYINTTNWDFYFKASGTYAIIGNIKGADATSNPRITSITSSATIQANCGTTDTYTVLALATNATINPPTGTPVDDQSMRYRIKDNGTFKTLTFGSGFAFMTTPPQYTVPTKYLYIDTSFNSNINKWVVTGWGQII